MNFLYPAFLYGLAVMAIPLIIHFFNFQRARKVQFTNVAFLATVKDITNARSRLRNILVLIARMLFLAFLVLAFARPFIPNKKAQTVTSGNFVSIYFDNSYSMQNEVGNRRLFDLAVNNIEKITELFAGNTSFQLLDNGFEGSNNFFFERDRVLDKLSEASYSNTGRQLGYVYDKQANALEGKSPVGSHIFWVSDFQRASVGNLAELELDTINSFYIVPLMPSGTGNLYIDSVWLENPFIKERENNVVHIKVTNFGNEAISNRAVKLYIEDKQVSANTISVDANSNETIELTFAVSEAGEKRCRISLEDYPVTFDNDYFFILKVAPKIKIISITGGQSEFVENVYDSEPFFEVQTYNVNALDYSALNAADLIVLENLRTIDNALLVSLQRAVSNGSSLAIFPGPSPGEESYTSLLQLPVTIPPVPEAKDGSLLQAGVEPPSISNPFFEGVFEKVSPNMSMPRGAAVISWFGSGRELLKFKNNQPFLTAFNRGQSTVYLFAVPLDSRYTNLQKHAVFVPTMYKIALASKVRNDRLSWSFSESIATVTLDSLQKNDIFKLVDGDFELIPAQRIVGNQVLVNIPENDMEAGGYQLVHTRNGKVYAHVAFNYDNTESRTNYYTASELEGIFNGMPNVQVYEVEDEEQLLSKFQDNNISTPLYRYALLLALLFLLVEILLIRFWKEA